MTRIEVHTGNINIYNITQEANDTLTMAIKYSSDITAIKVSLLYSLIELSIQGKNGWVIGIFQERENREALYVGKYRKGRNGPEYALSKKGEWIKLTDWWSEPLPKNTFRIPMPKGKR